MTAETTVRLGDFLITMIITGAEWVENCYVIYHSLSGEQALIDPGGNAETIGQTVLAGNGQLKHILLTHAHHDHVGAVAEVCRRFNLSCAVHKDDVRLLRHAPLYALRFARQKIERPEPFDAFDGQPGFRIGTQPIHVIYTPGHTPGGVCYLINDMVFTGDTLLRERVGRTDLPGGNLVELKDSINRLLDVLPAETTLFPGHGLPWTIGKARIWWSGVATSPPAFTHYSNGILE